MRRVLPIFFNTEMVWAILDGRKNCTRRTVKGYIPNDAQFGYTAFTPDGSISCRGLFETTGRPGYGEKFFKLPYQPGDILYVRETFAWCPCWDCGLNTEETGCGHEEERIYNDQKGNMDVTYTGRCLKITSIRQLIRGIRPFICQKKQLESGLKLRM